MRIAVTGALGWVGRSVVAWLHANGHEVLVMDREIPDGRGVAWDCALEMGPEARRALTTSQAVIHCAGHVHRPRETPEECRRFFEVNTGGTERLLRACSDSGPRRVVLVSTIALYDWSIDGPRSEEAPTLCPTAYADSKLQAEKAVRGSGLDWRIARLATVFGTGDRANFSKLARALARRRFALPGEGSARKSVLPIERAGEMLGRLVLRDEPPHRIFNFADPVAPSLAEICAGFSQHCGFPAPFRIPLGLLRVAGRLGDGLARVYPRFPVTSLNLRKLTGSTVVDTTRQQAAFPEVVWEGFNAALKRHAGFYSSEI